MDLFAPNGAIKSTLWPASRKNKFRYIFEKCTEILSKNVEIDNHGNSINADLNFIQLLKFLIEVSINFF